AEAVSLPPDATDAWRRQFDAWGLNAATAWAVAGVHPRRRDAFVKWLEGQGARVWVATDPRQLPLEVRLEHPERVGIDRLLNAVAARLCWERRRLPAVVADAGSAVTVDWLGRARGVPGGRPLPRLPLLGHAPHAFTPPPP